MQPSGGQHAVTRILTPDSYYAYIDPVKVCECQCLSFGRECECFGPAFTIKCFEDNRLVNKASKTPGEGRVLVVDAGGSMKVAMMGDMLVSHAMRNGWAAAVIFGVIRDTPQIDPPHLRLKALGTTAPPAGPAHGGPTLKPVSLGRL